MGPCGGEQAHQVHGAGLIGWHTLPSSVSPMTVHPWEPSLPRLQGCDSSPGHQGEIEMTFILCNLYWCIGDLQCCRVCLFVFVLGGQQHDPLMHRCVHVLSWVLFPYSLLCSIEYGSLLIILKSSVYMFINTFSFLIAPHFSLLVTIRCFAML